MTRLEALEEEVQKLSPEEFQAFRKWLADYDWQLWDEEFERDVAAGKFDTLAAEALAEFERGETIAVEDLPCFKRGRHPPR
jgi:succinate dehydrogenase flavin-adding protein (antitoxin of CptAB toxin-antitoxin module)